MKLRIFGTFAILAVVGAWALIFALADQWMEHLRLVNDEPYGYYEIGMLPYVVPLAVILLVGLWFLGPIVGRALVDWLRK